MASGRSSSASWFSSQRFRRFGLLALTALPAVVLALLGLGYLRYEVAIAERERNASAKSYAHRAAAALNEGLENYRQRPEQQLRMLKSLDFGRMNPPQPWNSAVHQRAFQEYENALNDKEHASELLEKSLANFDDRKTPAGLPLRVLAEYQLARLASEVGDETAVLRWLSSLLPLAIETEPSVVTPTLIEQAAALAGKHRLGEVIRLAYWQSRWLHSNQTRELVRCNRDKLMSQLNIAEWFSDGGEEFYWELRDSNESLVYSKPELEALAGELVADLIREEERRRYPLAIRITFGTDAFKDILPAPLNDPVQREARFQRLGYSPILHAPQSGSPLASASGGLFAVRVGMADPEGFRAAVQRRALTQGAFLLAVIACLGAGVWLSWRAMESQRRLNSQQADFISSVSHELRAPVAGIRLLSERLAKDGIETSKRSEYVDLIGREASRLGTLVSNVLDVTRIGKGSKVYRFEPTDIEALAQDTVDRMRPLAEERGMVIEMEAVALKEAPVIDAVAIQQALGNLIDNAIKFSPEGGKITVTLQAQDPVGFLLAVGDEGPGVAKEEQEKIFERFYRVGSELRRETSGAGIGLNLVRHIAEAHDGTITVESKPGSGSRFVLQIPR